MSSSPPPYTALVLAGGAGRRLGGGDKPLRQVGGTTLLDRVLAAVESATQRVVVGPPLPVRSVVTWVREKPPGGGPVAAVAAGLPLVSTPVTVLLAADLPFIAPAIDRLRDALNGREAVALADPGGRLNYLAAAWTTAALRLAVARLADPAGTPMRALGTPVAVPDGGGWGDDCDTPDQLAAARARAAGQEQQ